MSIVRDRLDAATVIATIEQLERRIMARFPERGLPLAAAELKAAALDVATVEARMRGWLRGVRWASRILSALVAIGMALVLVIAAREADITGSVRSVDWVALVESTIQTLVFGGLTILFLQALPDRLERRQLLRQLHRLRSLAHVIDMHQLTKDPERLRGDFQPTEQTVAIDLTRGQMQHYLDYCSELLSLVAKAAALTAEESQDSLILETVSDIENLTTGMSRKIWQKITLLASA